MEEQGLLQIKQVSFRYGERLVLRDIGFSLLPGDLLALLGPNGSGKTTLLKILLGTLSSEEGEVRLEGKPLLSYSPRERAKRIGYVSQQPALAFPLTVWELVSLGRYPYLRRFQPQPSESPSVEEALRQTGAWELRQRKFATLSGGEQQRVLIARALAQTSRLLLMDEPTVHLDISVQLQMLRTLRTLCREQQSTVVAVFHDLNLASLFANKALLLRAGEIQAFGPVETVVHERALQETFGIGVVMTRDQETGARYFFPRTPFE